MSTEYQRKLWRRLKHAELLRAMEAGDVATVARVQRALLQRDWSEEMREARKLWRVEVVDWQTSKVEKRLHPVMSKRRAEKIERGLNINLNHDRYETRIVQVCFECKERFSRKAVVMQEKEYCSDSCAADVAAKVVKADVA